MKRVFALLVCAVLMVTLCACSLSIDPGKNPKPNPNDTVKVSVAQNTDSVTVTMSRMPFYVSDLDEFDFTDEYQAAAALFCTLANFENNYDNALKMLDVMMGAESPSAYDESFIKNQLDQYPYVMRSYFNGATVENGYTLDGVSITFTEGPYSRDTEGYVKPFATSSGADSPRSFTLKLKESTAEWFLFSDTYRGLMAGIREPASKD